MENKSHKTGTHKASLLTDSFPISAFNFKIHNIYDSKVFLIIFPLQVVCRCNGFRKLTVM